MHIMRLLFPQDEEIWCIQSLPAQKLLNSPVQAGTFSAALPVPSHPAGDGVTKAAHSLWNTGTSQVRAGRYFLLCSLPFPVTPFCLMKLHFYKLLGCVPAWCEMTWWFQCYSSKLWLLSSRMSCGRVSRERNELAMTEVSLLPVYQPPLLQIPSQSKCCCSGKVPVGEGRSTPWLSSCIRHHSILM